MPDALRYDARNSIAAKAASYKKKKPTAAIEGCDYDLLFVGEAFMPDALRYEVRKFIG